MKTGSRTNYLITFLLVLGVCFLVFSKIKLSLATDFSGNSFTVRDPVFSDGAGYSTSTSFSLWSSLSQPSIGVSTSSSKELRSGFLYFSVVATSTSSSTTSTTPGGGAIFPPVQSPYLPEPLLSFITGESIPLECHGVNFSDLNCDGKVNLQDLSILFSHPKVATTRVLSLLFSNWTERLLSPSLVDAESLLPEEPSSLKITNQSSGLAQLENFISTSTNEKIVKPAISIWQKTSGLIKKALNLFAKIVIGVFHVIKVLITR